MVADDSSFHIAKKNAELFQSGVNSSFGKGEKE
jgi:hypothetical protein